MNTVYNAWTKQVVFEGSNQECWDWIMSQAENWGDRKIFRTWKDGNGDTFYDVGRVYIFNQQIVIGYVSRWIDGSAFLCCSSSTGPSVLILQHFGRQNRGATSRFVCPVGPRRNKMTQENAGTLTNAGISWCFPFILLENKRRYKEKNRSSQILDFPMFWLAFARPSD